METIYYSKAMGGLLPVLKEQLRRNFAGCKKIAVKLHFGEPGNRTALTPEMVKPITDLLHELKMNFFLVDSLVTYASPRNEQGSYLKYAEKKWAKLGEVRVATDYVSVKGAHLTYQVIKDLADADGVLVISHFKGHACSGFGGAIKNLGMGALSKKSKGDIHDGGSPVFRGKCAKCGACVNACPLGTLRLADGPVFGECYGCSNCTRTCPRGLLKPKLKDFDTLLADGANAAQSAFKKFYYVTLMVNITRWCDCAADPKEIMAKDAGYLAGKDAVAIDQAARDIVVREAGEDVFLKHNKKTGLDHVLAAEKFGMGNSKYRLATGA